MQHLYNNSTEEWESRSIIFLRTRKNISLITATKKHHSFIIIAEFIGPAKTFVVHYKDIPSQPLYGHIQQQQQRSSYQTGIFPNKWHKHCEPFFPPGQIYIPGSSTDDALALEWDQAPAPPFGVVIKYGLNADIDKWMTTIYNWHFCNEWR